METTFALDPEGLDMVYFTSPDVPPAVVYQAAATAKPASVQGNSTYIRRVEYGVCGGIKAVETNRVLNEWQLKANTLTPTMYAIDLLSKNKRDELSAVGGSANVDWDWYNKWKNSLKISILRPPAHAQLGDQQRDTNLPIVPNTDYLGKDRVDVLVEGKDDLERPFALTLRYYLTVLNQTEERRIYGGKDLPFKELCGKNHNRWRISELGESGFIAKAQGDLAAWQRSASLSALIASAQQTLAGFTDLPGTALGQTTGEGATAAITLDQNAAGHGWYIDPTPLDTTDDYLPTSNREVWQAKVGSAAAGKMDLLSVLLHEYGHALGLEHSADSSNYMAASLHPGVRKLPTAAELTLMARLVAELKGDQSGEALTPTLSQGEREQDPANPFAPSPLSVLGLLPLGLMRRTGSTSASSATHTDYLTAINPTLTNGNFTAVQNGTPAQWETTGKVDATPSTITLGESTTAQAPHAHVAQAFILTPQDRFLTFTLKSLGKPGVRSCKATEDALALLLRECQVK